VGSNTRRPEWVSRGGSFATSFVASGSWIIKHTSSRTRRPPGLCVRSRARSPSSRRPRWSPIWRLRSGANARPASRSTVATATLSRGTESRPAQGAARLVPRHGFGLPCSGRLSRFQRLGDCSQERLAPFDFWDENCPPLIEAWAFRNPESWPGQSPQWLCDKASARRPR
jgi:hypothetical protein